MDYRTKYDSSEYEDVDADPDIRENVSDLEQDIRGLERGLFAGRLPSHYIGRLSRLRDRIDAVICQLGGEI